MDSGAAVPETPLLHLRHVSKTFGGVKALDDVSFDVRPGEVLCLAGENGCGKSTLIKLVTGVHRPEPGAIMLFRGRSIEGLTPARARDLGIRVIWQDLALFPEMSVAENIGFERNLGRLRLVSYAAARAAAAQILHRLGVSLDLEASVRTLPIAQRQLVAIARALVTDAALVFMDEPTASLSHAETESLLQVVRRLSNEGIAVVFVSHRLAEVLEICTRVTVLRDGRTVGAYPTAGMTQTRLTELMTGKSLARVEAAVKREQAPTVLAVENLTRPGDYADVSLQVHAGEILGLTGRLGSGRTELALTLFGMTRPAQGVITLNGRPANFRSNRDAIAAGIAYVSEDRLALGLVQPQSIADNAAAASLDRLLSPPPLLSPGKRAALAERWVAALDIKIGRPGDPVSTLSGGNQQRIVLAKWLATDPRLLILDSPTVGVDVGARAGIFAIIRRLAEQGVAILLISDEVTEVYANAARILHMHEGRIVAEYRPGVVTAEAIEQAIHA